MISEQHYDCCVQAVFLVGGFGSSGYLREAISAAHPEIQVIQPDDAYV